MLSPSKGLKVVVKVDEIQLDPEDELTQNVDPKNVVYYIYENRNLVGILNPNDPLNQQCNVLMTPAIVNDSSGLLSIIARDATQYLASGEPFP